MKNKIFIGLAILSIVAITTINLNLSLDGEKQKIDLSLAEVEVQAFDLIEWWDRNDYKCISVTCMNIFGEWPSTVAQSVENGTGDAAHTWSCPGSDGSGWKVN